MSNATTLVNSPKDAVALVVITYITVKASIGLYHLGVDLKNAAAEKLDNYLMK